MPEFNTADVPSHLSPRRKVQFLEAKARRLRSEYAQAAVAASILQDKLDLIRAALSANTGHIIQILKAQSF